MAPRQQNGVRRKKRHPSAPFEYDAPKFTDFTHQSYEETKGLLERALNIRTAGEFVVTEFGLGTKILGGYEESEDDWFQRPHPSHEPTSPFSPPGPLITPESTRNNHRSDVSNDAAHYMQSEGRSSTSTRSSTQLSPTQRKHHSNEPAPLGLRSKPLRVLSRPCTAFIPSPGSSLRFQSTVAPVTPSINPVNYEDGNQCENHYMDDNENDNDDYMMDVDQMNTYHHRTSISYYISSDMVDGLLMEEPSGRISSLPSLSGWITSSGSTLASPPKCTLLPEDSLDNQDQHSANISANPLTTNNSNLATSGCTLRKFGMASRATRVQITTSTLLSEETNQAEGVSTSNVPSTHISPTIKRIRRDARFCPVPSTTIAKNQPNPFPDNRLSPKKKGKPVKIDDLKRILAEHNQRIRPKRKS